jgi:hypothetical protein
MNELPDTVWSLPWHALQRKLAEALGQEMIPMDNGPRATARHGRVPHACAPVPGSWLGRARGYSRASAECFWNHA